MTPIALTPEQEDLRKRIVALLDSLMDWKTLTADQTDAKLDHLSSLARSLHDSLAAEGQEPRYRPEALAKRGMSAAKPDFYRHMYAVELLLQYLEGA